MPERLRDASARILASTALADMISEPVCRKALSPGSDNDRRLLLLKWEISYEKHLGIARQALLRVYSRSM